MGDAATPTTIELHSGKYLDLARPNKDDFTIEDVAYGLSYNYRFGGQADPPITIAEHSNAVEFYLRKVLGCTHPPILMGALLHDAHEFGWGDRTSPAKRALSETARTEMRYNDIALISAIEMKFNFYYHRDLTEQERKLIKSTDVLMQGLEAAACMPSKGEGWSDRALNLRQQIIKEMLDAGYSSRRVFPCSLSPNDARNAFLIRFHALSAYLELHRGKAHAEKLADYDATQKAMDEDVQRKSS